MKLTALMIAGLLTTSAYAGSKVLPDACGDDAVKFDVKTEKDKPLPPGPEEGKALIVFISVVPEQGPMSPPIVRFGVDGAWVGATKGPSYIAISVAPGDHHFCASNLKSFGVPSVAGMGSITAEAGKVYYYEFSLLSALIAQHGGQIGGGSPGGPMGGGGGPTPSSSLYVVNEDEGRYRVKSSTFSTSTPKK